MNTYVIVVIVITIILSLVGSILGGKSVSDKHKQKLSDALELKKKNELDAQTKARLEIEQKAELQKEADKKAEEQKQAQIEKKAELQKEADKKAELERIEAENQAIQKAALDKENVRKAALQKIVDDNKAANDLEQAKIAKDVQDALNIVARNAAQKQITDAQQAQYLIIQQQQLQQSQQKEAEQRLISERALLEQKRLNEANQAKIAKDVQDALNLVAQNAATKQLFEANEAKAKLEEQNRITIANNLNARKDADEAAIKEIMNRMEQDEQKQKVENFSKKFSYKGNNGTVTGDVYCKGRYESKNGNDKNLKCLGGINLVDNTHLNCNTAYGHGGLGYQCEGDSLYRGNNGSVSGDVYCAGAYESITVGDKNLKCEGGVNLLDNTPLDCGTVYGHADLGYNCVPIHKQPIRFGGFGRELNPPQDSTSFIDSPVSSNATHDIYRRL